MFFKTLGETAALLRCRGGFKTAPVVERDGRVLAKIGQSYHDLTPNGSVIGTNLQWVEFEGERAGDIFMGRLNVEIREPVSQIKPTLRAA